VKSLNVRLYSGLVNLNCSFVMTGKYEKLLSGVFATPKSKNIFESIKESNKASLLRKAIIYFSSLSIVTKYACGIALLSFCVFLPLYVHFFTPKIATITDCLDEDICKIEEFFISDVVDGVSHYYLYSNKSSIKIDAGDENYILAHTQNGRRIKLNPTEFIIKNNDKKTLFYNTSQKKWIINYW